MSNKFGSLASCRETPPPREEPATRPLCAIVEEVLDWRPSNYFTVSTLLPIPDAPKIMLTHAFQDRANGTTHIEMRVAKPKPKDRAFVDQAAAKFKENITKAVEKLRLMLEEQQTPVPMIDEPPLIDS